MTQLSSILLAVQGKATGPAPKDGSGPLRQQRKDGTGVNCTGTGVPKRDGTGRSLLRMLLGKVSFRPLDLRHAWRERSASQAWGM